MSSSHGPNPDISLVPVAIFWDYENCSPPHSAGYTVVDNIRQIAHNYGTVKLFKAYLELSEQNSSRSLGLRSELQSCGVSLTDCPHNGRKDVADKMMIVDMLTYAIDTPAPATIILISGDRDFVYAISILRFRRYNVVVIAPSNAHSSLKSGASYLLDWDRDVLGKHARDRHARHVSADASANRSQWREPDIGARGSAIDSPVNSIPSPTATRGPRRHSCNARPSGMPSPTFLKCPSSEALGDLLSVPVAHSFPPTPHHNARALRAEPPGPPSRLPDAPGAVHLESNVLQAALDVAASNRRTPISPGTTTSGVFSDFEGTSSLFDGDNSPDSSSNCEAASETPARDIPLGETSSFDLATGERRANTNPVASCKFPAIATGADSPPSLSVRMATPDTAAEALGLRGELDNRTFAVWGAPGMPSVPGSIASARAGTSPTDYLQPTSIDLPLASLDSMPGANPFQSLIDILDSARRVGQTQLLRSHVAIQLTKRNERVYHTAGVTKFREFAALAAKFGIVELGGQEGNAWIALQPAWHEHGHSPA
ncbi:NYN domain-containing protein [Phanerochaete sordida]|uniref:NYN domain-containing protein n=1 Tax=Phanerochaete sordida TaxID=48140 RepID=A0A9P3GLS1_9APHY|nr:NYN domain-containing protein [Phanerochaete sordida]